MTDKWIRETGLVFALAFLFLGWSGGKIYLALSTILILLTLLFPKSLFPLAYLWKMAVDFLGKIMPKVFFALVFYLVITPVGMVKRMFSSDNVVVHSWRKVSTLLIDRNHIFVKRDLERPY